MDASRKWTDPLTCKIADGLLEINGVKGFLQHGDIEILTHFALQMPLNAKIVEIGSFMGLSALIMARALYVSGKYGARIFCVDTWEGSEEHKSMEVIKKRLLFDTFEENIFESGLPTFFVPIRKDSVAASIDFQDQSFDMIFIDGDHKYKGCLADIQAWYPKLKPGGIFLGHDGEMEVRKAVDDFLKDKQDLSCIVFGVPSYSNYMYRLVERRLLLS
jgi:predicted O-methyltransferase YrrM